MKNQIIFQNVLAQLRSLSLHLCSLSLALQESYTSIQHPIEQIDQTKQKLQYIQTHLQAIQEAVIPKFERRCNVSDGNDSILIELIERTRQLTNSLIHLTEEYVIDPIGVQSCLLNVINSDACELQNRFVSLTFSRV